MSLYVGNLHPACNESILFKKFSLVGKVLSVRVCRNSRTSRSLGYGYVNFAHKEDAERAIESMGYDRLFDRAIRVMWATKDRAKFPAAANLVVKNIGLDKDELDLKDLFSNFGEVVSIMVPTDCRGDSKGFGFVQFKEVEAAEKAMAALNNTGFNGNILQVTRYIPPEERQKYRESVFPNNICITNLGAMSEETLADLCEAFGEVVSSKVVVRKDERGSDGIAFVSFRNRDSAKRAIVELNRLCFNGKKLNVNFAVRKRKKQQQA